MADVEIQQDVAQYVYQCPIPTEMKQVADVEIQQDAAQSAFESPTAVSAFPSGNFEAVGYSDGYKYYSGDHQLVHSN